jgi:hypothetical protein
MAGPIYQLYMGRTTEAWYQLSEEEQNSLLANVRDALEKVGGKTVIGCNTAWSSEQWHWFGVEEFPDIEAVQKLSEGHMELDWYRYFEGVRMLGTKGEPS